MDDHVDHIDICTLISCISIARKPHILDRESDLFLLTILAVQCTTLLTALVTTLVTTRD